MSEMPPEAISDNMITVLFAANWQTAVIFPRLTIASFQLIAKHYPVELATFIAGKHTSSSKENLTARNNLIKKMLETTSSDAIITYISTCILNRLNFTEDMVVVASTLLKYAPECTNVQELLLYLNLFEAKARKSGKFGVFIIQVCKWILKRGIDCKLNMGQILMLVEDGDLYHGKVKALMDVL